MSRITLPLLLAALAIAGSAHATGLTLHARKGSCQMTVPADWHVSKYGPYSADSPDGSMSALISASGPDTNLAFAKQVMEGSFPPKQVFEDSPKRLFYRYGEARKPGYYVGVPGHGRVCGSQISAPAGKEALVKQIAATVASSP